MASFRAKKKKSTKDYSNELQKRIIRKKLRKGNIDDSWRRKKMVKRAKREEQVIYNLEMKQSTSKGELSQSLTESANHLTGNHRKFYKLSIALPGSILNNAQTMELRTYLAGQIARAAAIFCVDEIIIFDDTARMTSEFRDTYFSGSWIGSTSIHQGLECNFQLAKILEYLECPQYLRKAAFPLQNALKYCGILNPLDSIHHLRQDDLHMPYREGIVLDKPVKKGRGPFCYVGLKKEVQLDSEINLPPGTRVTVKIADFSSEMKNFRGSLTSPAKIRSEAGLYWGYKVHLALSLNDAVHVKRYDVIIGTSDKGDPIEKFTLPLGEKNDILIVFGGLEGLEAAIDADESIETNDPSQFFDFYLNAVPDQGSRTIRTEEAIPISLTALKMKLDS